jgi:molybdate transport system substrate-binding protein
MGLAVLPVAGQGHGARENRMELYVYSGGAPRPVLARSAPEFEQATGHKVNLTFDGVSGLRQRLAAGEKADVVLLPAPMLEPMNRTGALRAGSRIILARSALGVVVRHGAALPEVSSPAAVRRMLLDARSIAYSDPKLAPSGVHLARVLEQMGIAEAVRSKTTLRTPFDGGVALIADGHVEVGIYLVSEIQVVRGVTLAGLLPSELQSYVVYAGAVTTDSPTPEAAVAFLRLLADPARRDYWTTAGFEPGDVK